MTTGQPTELEPAGESRRSVLRKAGAAGAGLAVLGFPAWLRAEDTVRIGHLTPRTGFLGQVGEYGFKGASLAVEEINASGGVLGRKLEMIAEDSVNPATAVTKAQKLIERDRVAALVGEVSSASALAIAEQAARAKIPFFNTGANSDALRGSNCNRFMFHIEGSNSMYVKTIGTYLKAANQLKGMKFYTLTADYAFGHDLYRVSSKFIKENGGILVANDMIPTNTPDYSAYILKLRQAKPDYVFLNLAGVDQTTFLKQFREYGLPFKLTGGAMDTVLFWSAGIDALSGIWQSLWYHGSTVPGAQAFTRRFQAKFGTPPENGAWSDYTGIRIVAQTWAETKTTDAQALVKHLEKGASFDILKERKGVFRPWDHQLLQEMLVVQVKQKAASADKWDVFSIDRPVPGPRENLEMIQPTQTENACRMPA